MKVGKTVFVSGTPGYGSDRKVAVGDFSAQIKQVMENIATSKDIWCQLGSRGENDCVLVRPSDFDEMNRVYAQYFTDGAFQARTTVIVSSLPSPDFLVEIECEAILDQ